MMAAQVFILVISSLRCRCSAHHPPMAVGSPWLDKMGLQNPAELFSITDRHPQSRGVICGHVHQEFSGKHGALQLFATPSTCVQFTPGSVSYGQDDKPPAYRHLLLHAGGEIETEVVNVSIRGRLQTQDK